MKVVPEVTWPDRGGCLSPNHMRYRPIWSCDFRYNFPRSSLMINGPVQHFSSLPSIQCSCFKFSFKTLFPILRMVFVMCFLSYCCFCLFGHEQCCVLFCCGIHLEGWEEPYYFLAFCFHFAFILLLRTLSSCLFHFYVNGKLSLTEFKKNGVKPVELWTEVL